MDLLAYGTRAAEAAARYLRAVVPPADPSQWDSKGQNDFVTGIDRRAEELIAESLTAAGGRILGEELSSEVPLEGLVWVVDPLDGTTNFLHGYPACAVSVAATIDGMVVAGVVLRLEPAVAWTAARGHGAWCDGRPIRVSPRTSPAHALIGTGFPFKRLELLDEYQRQFARILPRTSGIRRAGSAALDLADVAAGRFDGFWELWLAPWDVAAGLLLVTEAGGVVTDLSGEALRLGHGPVVAGSPAIHPWLLEVLQEP